MSFESPDDDAPAGTVATTQITPEERQLAARNHGFLLEALRYPVTPIGLHYLLTHYDVPEVDAGSWRLELGGRLRHPKRLTLEELRARPAVTRPVTMECAGNGRANLQPRAVSQPWGLEAVGNAAWTGTPLRGLLEEAGLHDDVHEIVFTGLDVGVEADIEQRYERSLPIAEAMRDEVMLAYSINGVPLPPQHGYPVRLIVPGWYGMTNVKWLTHIDAIDREFDGYQQRHAYRMLQRPEDAGAALTRMRPRSLLLPPGIPDFLTRERVLRPGATTLQGRAWSGYGPIAHVEVSTDGGGTWTTAALAPQPDRYDWVAWTHPWRATPGIHELACRATDAEGNTQPDEGEWNLGGYACNAVHTVTATVKDQ